MKMVLLGGVIVFLGVMSPPATVNSSPEPARVKVNELTKHTTNPVSWKENPSNSKESLLERIVWVVINGVLGVLIFSIGGDLYSRLKAWSTGTIHIWSREAAMWVDTARSCTLLIPEQFRDLMYATLNESGFKLKVVGFDSQTGRTWGDLVCHGGKHPVGSWVLTPSRTNRNRFELWFDQGLGNKKVATLKKAE